MHLKRKSEAPNYAILRMSAAGLYELKTRLIRIRTDYVRNYVSLPSRRTYGK